MARAKARDAEATAADTSAPELQETSAPEAPPAAATVGRIVHYYEETWVEGEDLRGPFAAMVTDLTARGEPVLEVFRPDGNRSILRGISYSETPAAGCWTWPPRA